VTTPTFRRLLRAGAVTLPVSATSAVLLAAPSAQAATPITWGDPQPMSVLQALLIFAGIPLGIILLVSLLVTAPSLVRGDRQQRGVSSWTEPQWFGGPRGAVPAGRHASRGELGSGEVHEHGRSQQLGGASARW
jgi:hypothetical protein